MCFLMSLSVQIPKHKKLMGRHSYRLFQRAPRCTRTVHLLPVHKCEHECGMVVEGFAKRNHYKGNRSGNWEQVGSTNA